MSLQLKWQYLQRTVPVVSTLMSPIEEDIREKFFPALFRGEDIDVNFHQILGHIKKNLVHSVKHGGLGIPDPRLSEESAYNTSNAARGKLVESLLVGIALNYVGHRACIRGASAIARKERKHVDMALLARQKDLA